ncbi:MAG: phenylacetate-CoA oxygenase/reductase subunit PaaK [Bacteroidota bacterium]|nr:phenylacetate-CoA oxygenase/reductase subunit PaaK [Bacteroidota bacterium]
MSLHFTKVTVAEVRKETHDCVSVLLNIPATLQKDFQFQQGQYLTVRAIINGQEIRRSYSLCSSPLDNEWRIAIKAVKGGIFSTYANTQLKAGDSLEIMQPLGRFFTPIDAAAKKNYVCFAAGSGITPVLSILTTVLRAEPESTCTLIYGNRNSQSIIFKEQLEALKNRYLQRFQLIHILSRERTETPLQHGRIDTEKLAALGKLVDWHSADTFFICGPQAMTQNIRSFLVEQHIDTAAIHTELFTSSSGEKANVKSQNTAATDKTPQCQLTIKTDGRSFELSLPMNSSILEAALQEGLDLPYACKGGVCCTCKAKLLEGKVQMDVHYGLEEDEIAQGFILTCQSHPLTEKVVVDYDVK